MLIMVDLKIYIIKLNKAKIKATRYGYFSEASG